MFIYKFEWHIREYGNIHTHTHRYYYTFIASIATAWTCMMFHVNVIPSFASCRMLKRKNFTTLVMRWPPRHTCKPIQSSYINSIQWDHIKLHLTISILKLFCSGSFHALISNQQLYLVVNVIYCVSGSVFQTNFNEASMSFLMLNTTELKSRNSIRDFHSPRQYYAQRWRIEIFASFLHSIIYS